MSTSVVNEEPVDILKGRLVEDLATGEQPPNGVKDRGDGLATTAASALFTFVDQALIVTGGARGLGLTVAISLLEAGAAAVYCLDLLAAPACDDWTVARHAAKRHGGSIEYMQVDITDAGAVDLVMTKIFNESPAPVSGLLAAAGIQQMIPAFEYPIDRFRQVMEVNVTGTFITIQAAARHFRDRQIKGSIVMVASMSGSIANKGLTCLAYNTSKSALLQMCRSAAAEWGAYGIRVNTLSPGYIRTAMTDGLLAERPDLEQEWLHGSMLNRLSTPDEFRGPSIFLLSQASSFMTGSDLLIDGGHTAF